MQISINIVSGSMYQIELIGSEISDHPDDVIDCEDIDALTVNLNDILNSFADDEREKL